jgi:hypothetical protein
MGLAILNLRSHFFATGIAFVVYSGMTAGASLSDGEDEAGLVAG